MATLENKATVSYYKEGVEFSIDSNTVEFNRVDNVMRLYKSVAPTRGKSGDQVTFSISAAATAPVTAAPLVDKLSGFTFVPGSVKIDNVPVTMADPNVGIDLGMQFYSAPTTCNISFDCTVD